MKPLKNMRKTVKSGKYKGKTYDVATVTSGPRGKRFLLYTEDGPVGFDEKDLK